MFLHLYIEQETDREGFKKANLTELNKTFIQNGINHSDNLTADKTKDFHMKSKLIKRMESMSIDGLDGIIFREGVIMSVKSAQRKKNYVQWQCG